MSITTRDARQAAVIQAAGHQVETRKQPCSPRCLFEFADTPVTRKLIEDFERRKALSIPPKSIMAAYTNLLSACKALKEGAI